MSEVVNGLQLSLMFRPRHDGWDELAIGLKNAGSETFDIGSRVLVFLEARVGPDAGGLFSTLVGILVGASNY